MGNNKFHQLGQNITANTNNQPEVVEGFLGEKGSNCFDISCGWSHNIAHVKNKGSQFAVYGWGRNDKGQLGTLQSKVINYPQAVFKDINVLSVCCGSESTICLDERTFDIYSCGWNEHGNLSHGNTLNAYELHKVSTNEVVFNSKNRPLIAAGGAHVIVAN